MGAVTLVGVGVTAWGTTTATPGSAGTPTNGDQPYILAVSKRPSVGEPAAPAGWTRILSEIANAAGTVGGNTGPMYVQLFERDTLVSGGAITWPAITNFSGTGQVIGLTPLLARPAAGEALVVAVTFGEDLDGAAACVTTGADALPLGVGDLVVAVSGICDNGVTSSAGAITAAGITFGTTTEQADSNTGNGDDQGCYVHTAAVTAGTATAEPVLSQTLSSSSATQNRVGTGFLRIRSAPTSVAKSGGDSGVGSESGSVAAAVSGGDAGVGSEDGFVALLKTGADSGVGSESGFVAELQTGSDSGTGSEAGSISATTSGGDAAVGSESGALLASTSGGDAGVGGEGSGFITLPGSDSGTGASALVALDASTSGGDAGVGSEGGYIEERFGDLVISIYAVDPDDGHLIPLPDHEKLDLSRERNGAGNISFDYPSNGQDFQVLRNTLTDDRDLEIEIWTIGSKTGALRGFLDEAAGDDVVENSTWTFSGGFAETLMNEAVAFPAPIITTTTVTTTTKISVDPAPASYQVVKKTTVASSAGGTPVTTTVTTTESSGSEGTTTDSKSTKGDLEFKAVTPGALVNTLLDQAQDRTALAGLVRGFTATHDSAGVAWPQVITSKFSPGSEYDSVLARLVDFGLAEWGVSWTGSAYRLDLWVIFGRGVDRTTGLRPIVLRKARNLIDAPRKWSVREAGTTVLAAGSEGVYQHASDIDAQARRGRRIERFASASNLTDPTAVQAFAQNQLVVTASGQLQIDHGIAFLPGEPRPVAAFDIGDWVFSETSGSAGRERVRVVQWTLSVDASGASGTVTLNDTFTDVISRLKARIDNLTSGDTVVGTSTGSGGQDTSTPLPPEVLSADSLAFLDGTLGVRASVTVALEMPVLNVDGTVITDMESVVVQYALASSPDVWNAGITKHAPTGTATFTAPAAQTITIRAAVVDRNGNTSAWSDPPLPHTTADDDIPPPIPSTPTVSEFLGTIRINWDQLTADGANMLGIVDFDHVEVHLSTGSLFTPDQTTLIGQVHAKQTFTVTDLPYGVAQFARLVAVDWSGNKSDPSGQGTATPAKLVNIDIGPNAIDRTQIINGEIVNAAIANLAVNNAKVADLSVGKLTSGTGTFDMILSGSIKTATTGNRSEIDNAGIRLYNGANIVVDFKTSNGSALVVGEFRTALTGQRVVFNPGGSLPDTLNFYPSAAGDFARIMARTAPGDGTAAILIDGGAANGTARGRIGAYKGEAFISHVTGDAGGDTSAGFSRTAVTCRPNDIGVWSQTSVRFNKYSGSTLLSGSNFEIKWVSGSTPNAPVLSAFDADCAVKLDGTFVCATDADGTSFYGMKANAFIVSSGQDAKTDIEPLADVVDALAAVRAAKPRRYRYRSDVARLGRKARHRFGVLAEEMPAELVAMTPSASGPDLEKSLNLADWQGLSHAALGQLADVVDALEQRLAALEGGTP